MACIGLDCGRWGDRLVCMTGEEIAKAFKAASRAAVRDAYARGLSVTFKRGKRIVRRSPDGSEEIVMELDKAYVRPTQRIYKLRP